MPELNLGPAAFLSYAHDDDELGDISRFRERLEFEVKRHLGRKFPIFFDRKNLGWGQQWKRTIQGALDEAMFLIPILTPSFFSSSECRTEVETFIRRERELGRDDLILPVYFIESLTLDDLATREGDPLAQALTGYQYADWRELRHDVRLESRSVSIAMADLARRLRDAVRRVEATRTDGTRALAPLPTPPLPRAEPGVAEDRPRTGPVRGGEAHFEVAAPPTLPASHPRAAASASPRRTDKAFETLPGVGGVVLHEASVLRIRSPLSIRSSRVEAGAAPLVLTPNLPQTVYYNQVPLPRPWVLDADAPREQLPGTHIRHPWVNPAEDFLEPALLQMPAELHSVLRDRRASADTARYLLPLKPRFFEFFSPDDAAAIVSISANPYGVVSVQLDVPVVGGNGVGQVITVQRIYKPKEETRSLERTFLSLWPNFEAAAWEDYYLLHFEVRGEASLAGWVEFYTDHGRIHPQAQRQQNGSLGEGVDRVERDFSTVVYHTSGVPHVIRFVRAEDGTAGILLPRLMNRKGAFLEQTSWQVGIDLGTSNTIVALKQSGQGNAPEVIRLGDATRIDFSGAVQPSAAGVWDATLNSYFFPREVSPAPFASQVFWRTDVRRDIPGIHANIPFSGEPSSHGGNALLANLKWSDDSQANHLTKLFLQQVAMMVRAEAIARAIPPESIEYSWSFPMAFTENKVNLFTWMWRAVLGRTVRSRDESTCALLFFCDGLQDFTSDATAAKVTVDVGSVTSDIACYAKGRALFRDSILFGGQELTGSGRIEGEERVFNPFVKKLIGYADAHGFNQSRVLERYNSSHSKFSYLVKTEWFARHHSDIAAQAWFEQFQCAVFYFYATLLYYVGLRLRAEKLAADQRPNIVFFGGNGSRFLDWLVDFSNWSTAQKGRYLRAFWAILHAGLASEADTAASSPRLDVRASASPKHEVAVGLLLDPAGLKIEQSHTGAALGEVVKVGGGDVLHAEASTRDASIAQERAKDLVFTAPFAEREIVRLNRAFVQQLQELGFSHATVQRARAQLEELDATFFSDAVAARLGSYFHAEGDQVFNGSLLTLEAASCLQRLL